MLCWRPLLPRAHSHCPPRTPHQASCSILAGSNTRCRGSSGRRPLLRSWQKTGSYARRPLVLCKASRQDGPQTLQTSRLKGLGAWLQKPTAPKPVPVDTKPPLQLPFQPEDPEGPGGGFKLSQLSYIWGLGMLSICYLHHSTTGFALPAMLPLISPDLKLTDSQGALLTVGYTVLYAFALIPVGFLADKTDRPRMLAGGAALWSLLSMGASKVTDFQGLLAIRAGLAAAQATQNPICFSLIPEMFPRRRNLAMSAYNSAIYAGRALSYAAVLIAAKLTERNRAGDSGVIMAPLDSLDLSLVSILYTQGNMAAITPSFNYNFKVLNTTVQIDSWRQLLYWLGPPGLVMATVILFTVAEPRKKGQGLLFSFLRKPEADDTPQEPLSGKRGPSGSRTASASSSRLAAQQGDADEASTSGQDSMWGSVRELLSSRAFQALTLAAAINDVGSWALVGWQATFYQRVFDVGPDQYAPALACLLPIGGIVGGVGGGLLADKLSRLGATSWLTSGATIAAVPVLVCNLLAPEYNQSLAALLVGFALSEMWRAPAAVMIRDVSPPSLGSTGSAVHLCIRNFVGGLGPIGVSVLADKVGLQKAMLLVPACFFVSGVGFFLAERALAADKAANLLPTGSPASLPEP